jgi:predicted Zn-dependent protease
VKAKIYLGTTVILLLAGIAVSQYRKPDVKASPDAVLFFIGDTEHELTRMPARFAQMSDADEIAVGNELARGIDDRSPRDAETLTLQRYVSRVGSAVAAHAHRKLPYRFHYVPERDFVNAYALPGGHVVIGAGLIELMDSEDELAVVLGHEIEHIDHYHCAERVETERALHKVPLSSLAAIPVLVFQAGYSKTQELEADREGVRLAAMAGYSPEAAVRMFQKFDRLFRETQNPSANPEEEVSRVVLDSISGYFRSHPPSADRVQQVQQMIATEHFAAHEQERPLETAYIMRTWEAEDNFRGHKFERAILMCNQALRSNPEHVPALRVRAASEFFLSGFAEAAEDYRKLLAQDINISAADRYADALAAAQPATAAGQFGEWLDSVRSQDDELWSELRADLAGLKLLAHSPSEAELLAAKAAHEGDGDVLARLGKWYYRSGDYVQAVNTLQYAVEARPGNTEYRLQLAWALIEAGRFESSLSRLNTTGTTSDEAGMCRAVASWRAKETDPALLEFKAVTREAAYWTNPTWTGALYAPGVSASIRQMKDETERRRLASIHRQ